VDYLDTTFIRKLSFKKWKRQVICWKRNFNFLPEQHFIIYAVKIKDKSMICDVAKQKHIKGERDSKVV